MKTITVLFILIGLNSYSQYSSKVPLNFYYSDTTKMGWMIATDSMTTTFVIRGDTMKLVKDLYEELSQSYATTAELYQLMRAGVAFMNNVPDYWKTSKNNPAYEEYWRLLQKQGYVFMDEPKKTHK